MTLMTDPISDVDQKWFVLKSLIDGAYDLQKVRIMIGNRICQQFRHYLGAAPSDKEEDMDKKAQKLLGVIREEYKLLSDGLAELRRRDKIEQFLAGRKGIISNFAELRLVEMFEDALAAEQTSFKNLQAFVEDHPLWKYFGDHIHGFGFTSCAVMISKININKAEYASSINKLCGLDVVNFDNENNPDGRARAKYQGHMEPREYIAKDGTKKTMMCATHDPWLKSKVLTIVAEGIIRARNPHYRGIYDNYKARIINDPKRQGTLKKLEDGTIARVFPDGTMETNLPNHIINRFKKDGVTEAVEYSKDRIHKMAKRFMVKIFIADMYEAWKQIVGEEPKDPYFAGKMGLRKHTVIRKIGDNYIVCNANTGVPVQQKPLKAENDSSETMNLETDREVRKPKKATGRRVSQKVQEKKGKLETKGDKIAA